MRENYGKDSTIKLFGKILPLFVESEFHPSKIVEEEEKKGENKEFSEADVTEITDTEEENYDDEDVQNQSTKEHEDSETSTESSVKPKRPPVNEKSTNSKTSNTEKEESNITEEKTLKKPDKILPCPRCKSMDTKFCYYNNYNVHQPRHFCKACQRYWTAGGTMRNVPVGAGRRKSKNSASHYRHLTIFEAQKTSGRVLNFGVDSPMSNSMAADKKKPLNGTGNSFHQNRISPVSFKGKENGNNCSSGSFVTVSNSNDEKGRIFASPNLWISGVPWPYQFPLQFYPPIWNCGSWNIPILSPQSSTNQEVSILGKRSRNGETVKPYESDKHEAERNKNGSVLVPKTLRSDDPDEAAKSSIWKTLGIKKEPVKGEKLLKTFQCKTEEKNRIPETSPVLMANPAALSRSMNFHESS